MPQATGSKGILAWKPEQTFGAPDFDLVGGGASTTLATSAVNAGATSIEVASDTNIAAGDILKVGDDDSVEYVEVDSGYSSGSTVALSSTTPINFRHEIGEAVVEVSPGGFTKIGAITGFSPGGGIGLFESAAIQGNRQGLENVRSGNYDVSGSFTIELATEGIGFALANVLGPYTTLGSTTSGGSTTLSAAASAGDTSVQLTSVTNYSDNDYIEIGSGSTVELARIDPTWDEAATTVPLLKRLRYDHANGENAVEKVSPFTHTIDRGALPTGLTMLLKFTDVNSIALYRGVKIESVDMSLEPGNLLTMTVNYVGKAVQILEKDIFATLSSVSHVPYAPWESVIKEGGSEIGTVENISLNIINNINTDGYVLGSRFRANAAEGDPRATGNFTYQYFDASLIKKAAFENESSLNALFTYTGDADHTLEIDLPRLKYSGSTHPGIPNSGPVTDQRDFTALRDGTKTTDVRFVVKTTEYTLS